MLTAKLKGRNPGFSLAEDTDELFVGKTFLHGVVLMWLMKTLLTSWCVNQREQVRTYRRNPVYIPDHLINSLLESTRPVIIYRHEDGSFRCGFVLR